MHRGIRTFKKDIDFSTDQEIRSSGLGRNPTLHKERNLLITARYYFYNALHNYTYIDAVKAVARDMFLSNETVCKILEEHTREIREMKERKTNAAELAATYTQYNWKTPKQLGSF